MCLFLLSLPAFLPSAIFFTQNKVRGGGGGEAPRLEPPLQIYRNKGITGLDAYSVKAINTSRGMPIVLGIFTCSSRNILGLSYYLVLFK